jgi:3'(2'), 5'-bisphosphate nucleotidase
MDPLLEIALRAALAGGEEVMRVYADPFEVIQKDDRTPVTEADLASERAIIAILTAAVPDIPIVSEETVPAEGFSSPASRFWCVDPLDGTKEFIVRNGEFSVLIALIEHGIPVLGVVHGPGTARGRREGGDFAPIRARVPSPDGIVVVHSRSHENSRRLAEYFQNRPVIERKQCGSALKFGVLAAGEADFYPRFGTTMEWDTAAGQAVLEAAGGHVFGLGGEPLGYGKPGLKNDGFLAWGAKPAW